MKNKTLAAWLAFLGGPLGLHRFYLKGSADRLGWLLWIPTTLGVYGVWRAKAFGLDDPLIWILIPGLGFTVASCALNAIVFGLSSPEKWNQKYNPNAPLDARSGHSNWFTIAAVISALLIGTTALMSSFAFVFQRYFEYQVEAAQQLSNPDDIKKSAN